MAQQFDLTGEIAISAGTNPQNDAVFGITDSVEFVPMAEFHTGAILALCTMPAGSTAVFTLLSADDAAGTNAAAIAGVTFTLTSTGAGSVIHGGVGFDQHDLIHPGQLFAGVRCVTDTNDTVISSILVRSDPRYSYDGVLAHV